MKKEKQVKDKFSLLKYLKITLFGSKSGNYYMEDGSETYRNPDDAVVRSYVLPKLKNIKNNINYDKSIRLLDVGCGNGTFSIYLNEVFNVVGTDSSIKMLKKFPVQFTLILANAYSLPFKEKSFEIVFEANVIHHIENDDSVISEMARLSKKYIIFIEPNILNPLMFLFSVFHKPDRKALKLRKKKLCNILKGYNFKIVKAIRTGMIFQNATPEILLPILKIFDGNFVCGAYLLMIFEKRE